MSKHTPGPWHSDDCHVYFGEDHSDKGKISNAITQGGCGCCNSWDDGVYNREDARLIAAAPELLEACLALLAEYECEKEVMPSYYQARAAISKATGEQE